MKKLIVLIFMSILAVANTANAAVISVDAQTNSVSGGTGASSGVFLTAGDFFTVTADPNDLWSAGALPRWSNADGLVADLFATGSDESGQANGTLIGRDFGLFSQLGASFPYGALVGSINTSLFVIGTNFADTATDTGELMLWYWDSNSGDNSNSVVATINTRGEEVPEPAIWLLSVLALIGLKLSRQR